MGGNEESLGRPRRSAGDWRGLIEEWRESGIDLTEFCRERRITASSLRWWRWRLGISSDPSACKAGGGAMLRAPRNEWIQLEIETPKSTGRGFELRWPNGRILAIPANFDAEALGRILAVVERSAC